MDIKELRKNEADLEIKISELLRQNDDLVDQMDLTRNKIDTSHNALKEISIQEVIGEATEIDVAEKQSELDKLISGDSENHKQLNIIKAGLKLLKQKHARSKAELRSAINTKLKESSNENIEAIGDELSDVASRYLIALGLKQGVPITQINIGRALERAVLGSESQNFSKFMNATMLKREQLLMETN